MGENIQEHPVRFEPRLHTFIIWSHKVMHLYNNLLNQKEHFFFISPLEHLWSPYIILFTILSPGDKFQLQEKHSAKQFSNIQSHFASSSWLKIKKKLFAQPSHTLIQ